VKKIMKIEKTLIGSILICKNEFLTP